MKAAGSPTQKINTNSVALHMDFNWAKMDEMLARYGNTLNFDYHTREAFYVVYMRIFGVGVGNSFKFHRLDTLVEVVALWVVVQGHSRSRRLLRHLGRRKLSVHLAYYA